MTDRIDPAEVARLREQLAQHFALPLKAGRHHPDWAVGPVAKHRGDHVSWYFTDLTEEQAKATAALLNALPALLDAADAAELRAENERLRGLLGRAVKYAREDRARTPGVTRLARALAEAEALLAKEKR